MTRSSSSSHSTRSSLKLILMRHGEAVQGGVSDHGRSLTPRGSQDSQSIGKQLTALLTRPYRILCSDATRTQETSENVSKFAHDHEITFVHELYTATSFDKFAKCIDKHVNSEDSCLMVIGHNPSISAFASALTGEPISFSTAECCILKSDETDWHIALESTGTWYTSAFISP